MRKHDKLVRTSKYLSKILRHQPDRIGLQLDPQGWVSIDQLLARTPKERGLDRLLLDEVVAINDKKRFELSSCGRRIRAAQGHSIPIDLGLSPAIPPELLYHGTAERVLPLILEGGLRPGGRTHVHLSSDIETALKVGARHGEPVVLRVRAGRAHAAGQSFFQAANGVWLTDPLAPAYLELTDP